VARNLPPRVDTGDYRLDTAGLNLKFMPIRIEPVPFASAAPGYQSTFKQGLQGFGLKRSLIKDVFGAKLRLFGDLI